MQRMYRLKNIKKKILNAHDYQHEVKLSKRNSFFNAEQLLNPLNIRSQNKTLELRYSPKNPRTIFEYRDNYSAALKLPLTSKQLLTNDFDLLKKSEPFILEHAARRVDLFFYTLVAYYKKEVSPELGWTKLQHGRGRHLFHNPSLTQASHSNLTPSLIDNTIKKKIPVQTVNYENLSYKTSLICGTHFMDSSAITSELPYFVNHFDEDLETTYECRKKSLDIIHKVSLGILDPIAGLREFLIMMDKIFTEVVNDKRFHKSIIDDKSLTDSEHLHFKSSLLKLIAKGTLINKWNKKTEDVNDDYIYMLLRLKPHEIKQCHNKFNLKNKILKEKMLAIQKEILSTPSAHVKISK